MIRPSILLATVVLAAATTAAAQTASDTAPRGVPMEAPVLAGATADPACGGLYDLAGKAFCVTAPLASISALAESYIAHFESEGWIAAAGESNRVVFVKRKPGGGCDGMQLQAFYDTSRPASPQAPGYIGMATIPGDVCAAATTPSAP
jgi:hypothetical protein